MDCAATEPRVDAEIGIGEPEFFTVPDAAEMALDLRLEDASSPGAYFSYSALRARPSGWGQQPTRWGACRRGDWRLDDLRRTDLWLTGEGSLIDGQAGHEPS